MQKKLFALAVGLALVAGLTSGEARYRTVAATATSQTIPFGAAAKVTIVNDGANEVYFRLFEESEPPAAVTTTNGTYLGPGASIEYGGPQLYGAVSFICDGAETTTVRLYFQ